MSKNELPHSPEHSRLGADCITRARSRFSPRRFEPKVLALDNPERVRVRYENTTTGTGQCSYRNPSNVPLPL